MRIPSIQHARSFAVATGLFFGATAVVATPPTGTSSKVHAKSAEQQATIVSAEAALLKLKQGNERFLSGKAEHPHVDPAWRSKLASGQRPFATILGCSDSRVTPALIFDEGLGDLFVIRVAGNIVDEPVLASIEYAVEYLDTRLVVVLGHEKCGAVTAAMQHLSSDEPRELIALVEHIHNQVCTHHDGEPDVDESTDLDTVVLKNTRRSQRTLQLSSELQRVAEKHPVKIVAAIYDLEGRVRWIDEK
ncbi:carbonic anhydrase [Neorhodopirellula lusitana]|uniref:Carbonic anhydrase n=1 Tax=Neorhodopirellula lusitana TaxID=445327 RepID=A0ABY1QR02_9BACT|nr:carbonic anhydrase [Neorhodopirellula lusitana]SMP78483.1 carbonic anhydrase [Neorhodopirellula lusitana]